MALGVKVTVDEIPAVIRLVDSLCGVVLDESKAYLIDSRLGRIVEQAGYASFAELCRKAKTIRTLQTQIVDAITTQETLFFRDNSSFEALKYKAIPESIDAKSSALFPKRLRIWSAACSTGQEPYSIAMTLSEQIPDIQTWDINILATDISDAALLHASTGRFQRHEIERGMTPNLLSKYFREEGNGWRVNDELRYMIRFDRRNLLQSFTELGPFDIIFCRNVAIYFDTDVKRDLFHRLSDRLVPNGYLFVGSSESLDHLDRRFVGQHHCRSVYYQPNHAAASAR